MPGVFESVKEPLAAQDPPRHRPAAAVLMQDLAKYALPLAGGALSVAALGLVSVQRKRRQAKAEALVAKTELVLAPRFSRLSPSMRAYNWNCYKWAAVNGPEAALRAFSLTLVLRPTQDLLSWVYTPFLAKGAVYCVEIDLNARGELRPAGGSSSASPAPPTPSAPSPAIAGLNLCVIKRREVPDFRKKRPEMLNRMLEAKTRLQTHQTYESCSHGVDLVLGALAPEVLARMDLLCLSGGRLTICGDLVESEDYVRRVASSSLAAADAILSFSPSPEQAAQIAKRGVQAAKEDRAVAARARAAREANEAKDRLVELEERLNSKDTPEKEKEALRRKIDSLNYRAQAAMNKKYFGSQGALKGGKGGKSGASVVMV